MHYYISIAVILLMSFISLKVISPKWGDDKEVLSQDSYEEILSDEIYVLGTIIQLRVSGKEGKKAIDEAVKRLYEIDDRMSAFKENSDISKINENAGIAPSNVNEDTYTVIKKAVYYADLSQGAFEPTIKPLVKLYNFRGENPSIPAKEEIEEALKLVNYKDIILNDKEKSVRLKKKNQSLDLGAIAKGYAADEVKRIFKNNNVKSAIIDLGGNIYALGKKADDTLWNIGIQDPLSSTGKYMGILSAADKSIVTSGNYERYFEIDGKRYHHIINPNTGYPCENGIISTTIISDQSIDGDGLTTCGYIMGLQSGLDLMEETEGVDAIFITTDKKVYITSGIKNNFKLMNEEYILENGI